MRRARRRISDLWDRFWFAPADLTALAVFRIAFGCLWLVILLASYPNWLRFFGPEGVVPLDTVSQVPALDGARLSIFFHTRTDLLTWLVYWAGLAVTIAFIVGWRTRLATIGLFLLVFSMANRAPSLIHGEDQIAKPLLFLACFAPLGCRLSIDALRAAAPSGYQSRWAQRSLQLAVVLVYVFSAPAKLVDDTTWIDGSAVYYVMASGNWARFPELAPLFYPRIVSELATYTTLLIEFGFVGLVWWARTRWIAIGSLAAMHVGLALVLQHVVFFNLSMVLALPLFAPDRDWTRIGRRVRALLPRRAPRELAGALAGSGRGGGT